MSRPGNGDAAGREAERPGEIPPRGWFAILKRVKAEVKDDLRRWESEGGNVPAVATPSPLPDDSAYPGVNAEVRH